MTALADRIAQTSLWGLDDSQAKRERLRRVMAPRVVEPALPYGPCCARCRHWGAADDRGFGECRVLVVVRDKALDGPAKGSIATVTEAVAFGVESEPLSTKGFTVGCSAFAPMT